MKIRAPFVGAITAGCLLGVTLPPRASAEITDDQFKQLKDLVTQQGQDLKQQNQRIDQLEKTHEQDLKAHEQDQQKIRELQQQLGETQTLATNFATLDYLFNDYVTFVGGNMLLPLGTYNERSAGWLNKFPDAPLPRNILQGTGVGIQLRGAVPLGECGDMFTYAVYGNNGPGSTQTNTIALQNTIDLTSGNVNFPNPHPDPSGGGRIGWFHNWKAHTDLELGVSGQYGQWDNSGNQIWSALVLDYALHISPYFEAKGEYVNTWQGTDDVGIIHPHGWWLQAGSKLAGFNLDFPLVNDLEPVAAGFVYYFSNTLLFEGDYEWVHSSGPAGNAVSPGFIAQLSYGF